jgi:hypothetical protein
MPLHPGEKGLRAKRVVTTKGDKKKRLRKVRAKECAVTGAILGSVDVVRAVGQTSAAVECVERRTAHWVTTHEAALNTAKR